MQFIRKAKEEDLSRIAEIYVYNLRINFLPIFNDVNFSFGQLQVLNIINYFSNTLLDQLYVYDDGLIKGFVQINNLELCKLYVEPFFQNQGIGKILIDYCIKKHGVTYLWALEKNARAIAFYQRNGFYLTSEKKFEEDTIEYLIKMKKGND